ncbi:MAG TPA: hypothetical protein PKK18_00245 [Chitinophagales bacterium]|nr:hypothetical protein [Chitinophagales bacterium]HMW13490.1 hypothetical protein [Chitinophagales bacterium]HMX59312.1 hypothetical protein [Chitinophagales bacterium]HMZ32504.1 hypothetical protein [Chitinophagales bacterium]HNA39858.1 hypothetical protein [Chitinophagales bacterium]
MKKLLFILSICILPFFIQAQGTYIPIGSETNRYLQRLEIKTGLVKGFHTSNRPYDRKMSIDYINSIDSLSDMDVDDLTEMDKKNIDYLYKDNFEFDDFHTEMTESPKLKFLWKHPAHFISVKVPHFALAVNPAIQIRLGGSFKDEPTKKDKFRYFTSKGFEIRGQVDDIFGFYALFLSEQGNYPNYIRDYVKQIGTPPSAGYWKQYKRDGYDYFLAKGYVTISPSKHFHMQFGYDNNFIGDGIRSTFLSDFGANYLFLKLNTNVWKFNYQNIFAEMTKYYKQSGADRLLTKKYMAMHHLSINLTKNVNIGVFESVVFRRENNFELQYLNPIIFYRSIEQALGSPDNAFIGFDFKVNIPKHVQIYGQLLLDEFNFKKEFSTPGKSKVYSLFHPRKWWGNKFAAQLGIKYIDAFGVDHLDLQLEANMARPYTYSHYDTITSWTHYNQPLSHPLGANFKELIFQVNYQPLQKLFLSSRFIYTNKGEDNDTTNWGGNPLKVYGTFEREYGNVTGQGVNAKTFYVDFVATYEVWHNIFVDLTYVYRKKKSQDVARNMQTHYLNLNMRWSIPYRRFDF